MGADIHLVLEQHDDNLGWVGLHSFSWEILFATSGKPHETSFPARNRNYELFAALAGVRGDGPAPKGLPGDASDLTLLRLSERDDDLHSHTWYPLAEAVESYVRANDEVPAHVAAKLIGEAVPRPPLLRYFGLDFDNPKDIEHYRLCIAFDD